MAACALAALLSLAPAAWAQVDVGRLAELVQAGDYEAAYELAHEHVGDMAGNVDFDFYYGIAAVDTGNLSEGIFALERVLIAQPGADRARLELARAYFLRGDDRRARREFEAVEAHDPPAPVQAQIERYQLAMQRRAGRYETTVTGYLEAGIGHDSNVNSATASDTVDTVVGEIGLSSGNQEKSDSFGRLEGRVRVSNPVSPGVNLLGEVGARGRFHGEEDQFDTGNLDGRVGAVLRRPEWQLRGTLNLGRFYVDGESYRDLVGITGIYQRSLGERTTANGSLELADLSYDNRSTLDSSIWILGGGMTHTLATKRRPTMSGQVYVGGQQADSDSTQAQADAERDLVGIQGGVRVRLAPEWTFDGTAEARASEYEQAGLLFSEPRDETYYRLELAFDWRPRARWTIGPRLRYTSNDSNISLYEYDRTEIQIRARYDFY